MKRTPLTRYEAKIDLHGYTLQAAHKLFSDFLEHCFEEEVSTILVVTGKGGKSESSTINYEFPHWCETKPLSKYIKSVKQADIKHGGSGAFYVKLQS